MNHFFAITTFLLATLTATAGSGEDLMATRNGGFDQGLTNWLVHFPDHDFLKNNRDFVSVVDDGSRKNVLRFYLSQVATDNWGVQALSHPVPIDPKMRYKLTVTARSTGPSGRLYVMGKRMKPGLRPRPAPSNDQVRDVFKGPILSFTGEKGTAQFSNVRRTWGTASVEIPPRDLTELAYGFWNNCRYIEIHLVGIGGKAGEFFVDDVKLEAIGPVKHPG